jgi:hypothetical protein
VKHQLYSVLSILAIVAYFVPVIIVLLKKLWHVTPFLLFALYWLFGGLVNLIDIFPPSRRTTEIITVIYNTIDMPVILCIFYFTTSSAAIRRFVLIAAPGYALVAISSLVIRGINYDALKYALAVGLLLVMFIIIWEIILYLQKIVHNGREKGLLFIYAGLLFEYGTYIVIYIFDYYLENVSSQMDNFLVYYISSLIAVVIACCGFLTKGISKKPGFLT